MGVLRLMKRIRCLGVRIHLIMILLRRIDVMISMACILDGVSFVGFFVIPLHSRSNTSNIDVLHNSLDCHLGGDLRPGHRSRWDTVVARAFRRLFETGQFSVLIFRLMISPFYLHRTMLSTWSGKWIVNQRHVRLELIVLRPYPDDFSRSHNSKAKLCVLCPHSGPFPWWSKSEPGLY